MSVKKFKKYNVKKSQQMAMNLPDLAKFLDI